MRNAASILIFSICVSCAVPATRAAVFGTGLPIDRMLVSEPRLPDSLRSALAATTVQAGQRGQIAQASQSLQTANSTAQTAEAARTAQTAQTAQTAKAARTAQTADLDQEMNASERRHLLVRTGIGAAPRDLLSLTGMTRAEGIAFIVENLRTEPQTLMPAWTRLPPPHYHARADMSDDERQRFNRDRDREIGELRRWWVREMLVTDSPQSERLAFFWHDLFATDVRATDRRSLAMALQNRTFRRLGSGSWEHLLKAMIRDPALLDYLDNGSNRAESPNENLARELMELFALGEGNYTQHDVREAARALTGYGSSDTAGLAFRLRTGMHDDGDKTLFGKPGVRDGDDLIERILAEPAAARYLAQRFWQAFISDGEPEADWMDAVSSAFRDSDHDVSVLYRETLESEAFWAARHRGAIVRSPLDLIVGTARSLDYPKRQWQELAASLTELGLNLFSPPDVAGWREGDAWIASGALLDRRRLVERVFSAVAGMGGHGEPAPGDEGMQMDAPMAGDEKMFAPADARVAMATDAAMATNTDVAALPMNEVSGDHEDPLVLRVAAEDYRGAARWQVSLLAEGETVWEDQPRSLDDGHDTERRGRLASGADKPWQTVVIDAPLDTVASADAIAVAFLNDAAGSEGDRNVYVDGVFWQGAWRPASDGRQSGACPPEDAASQGALYCAGELVLARPDGAGARDAKLPLDALPVYRAGALHVTWSRSDPADARHALRLALDDVETPAGAFHRLQFTVHAIEDRPLEFRVNSFDCIPDCVPVWPECAWSDKGFPALQTVSIPLNPDVDAAHVPCHLDSLPSAYRQLYKTLGRSLPSLLAHVTRLPSAERREEALLYFTERLQQSDSASGRDKREGSSGAGVVNDGVVFVVDPRYAVAPLPPAIFDPPDVAADSPAVLVEALDAAGLSLVDVLLAGFDDDDLSPLMAREGDTPLDSIRRLVEHPAFQVR